MVEALANKTKPWPGEPTTGIGQAVDWLRKKALSPMQRSHGIPGAVAGMADDVLGGIQRGYENYSSGDYGGMAKEAGMLALPFATGAVARPISAAIKAAPLTTALGTGIVGPLFGTAEAGESKKVLDATSRPLEEFLPRPVKEEVPQPRPWSESTGVGPKRWSEMEAARLRPLIAGIEQRYAESLKGWPQQAEQARMAAIDSAQKAQTAEANRPLRERSPELAYAMTLLPLALTGVHGFKLGRVTQQEANAAREAYNAATKRPSVAPPAMGHIPYSDLATTAAMSGASELTPNIIDYLTLGPGTRGHIEATQTLDPTTVDPWGRAGAGALLNYITGGTAAKLGQATVPVTPLRPPKTRSRKVK